MANEQGITKSQFHNGDTALKFPNADREFDEDCEEEHKDWNCRPQDDIEFDLTGLEINYRTVWKLKAFDVSLDQGWEFINLF